MVLPVSADPRLVAPPVKPAGIAMLETLAVIASVMLVYAGIALALHQGTSSEGPESSGLAITLALGYGVVFGLSAIAPFVLAILAIVYLATAVGLFIDRKWAWSLGIALSVVNIGLNLTQEIVFFPFGLSGWVTLLIAFIALHYLARPRVRRFFAKQSSGRLSS